MRPTVKANYGSNHSIHRLEYTSPPASPVHDLRHTILKGTQYPRFINGII